MAGLSDYSAQAFLNWMTGNSPVPALASRYLALFTAAPTADAGSGGTEVSTSSTGYARVQVAGAIAAAASFTTASTTITMGAANPGWVVAGMNVYDTTAGANIGTVQSYSGTTLTLTINRDQASRYGLTAQMIDDTLYDAFGQREIAQYFTQLSSYYVIMEVLPALQGDPSTLDKIFLRSPTTSGQVPLSAFAKWTTVPIQPLSISHQGQFPAITISFNLAPNAALGQATEAVQRAMAEIGTPSDAWPTLSPLVDHPNPSIAVSACRACLATAPRIYRGAAARRLS